MAIGRAERRCASRRLPAHRNVAEDGEDQRTVERRDDSPQQRYYTAPVAVTTATSRARAATLRQRRSRPRARTEDDQRDTDRIDDTQAPEVTRGELPAVTHAGHRTALVSKYTGSAQISGLVPTRQESTPVAQAAIAR